MLGSLGLYWWLLKAVLAIWSLCWSHFGQPGVLMAVFEGDVEPFGSRAGSIMGTLGLSWRLLMPMLVRLEAVLGLCWPA